MRSFGGVVVGEALVAPVGEEGAGLERGRVEGGDEYRRYEWSDSCEVGVGVG